MSAWLKRLFHRHTWHDGDEFISCFEQYRSSNLWVRKTKAIQRWQHCDCGALRRKPGYVRAPKLHEEFEISSLERFT